MKKTFILLRVLMALIFLWAFFDKLLGLGFATTPDKAWLSGGSPTMGFLTYGTHGPFASFFQGLSGLPVVDWIFMIGLLFIGLSLLLNIFVKWGSIAGAVMMALMYLAAIPPENHPFLDDHIIYLVVFILLSQLDKEESNEKNIS